jgi:hypothetical protein
MLGATLRALLVGTCIGVPCGVAKVFSFPAADLPILRLPRTCLCSGRARPEDSPKGTLLTAPRELQSLVGFALKGQWLAVAYGCVAAVLACVVLVLLLRLGALWRGRRRPMHAAVVVLGDIGRSPRMMNHAGKNS